jgi:hypothetical protein
MLLLSAQVGVTPGVPQTGHPKFQSAIIMPESGFCERPMRRPAASPIPESTEAVGGNRNGRSQGPRPRLSPFGPGRGGMRPVSGPALAPDGDGRNYFPVSRLQDPPRRPITEADEGETADYRSRKRPVEASGPASIRPRPAKDSGPPSRTPRRGEPAHPAAADTRPARSAQQPLPQPARSSRGLRSAASRPPFVSPLLPARGRPLVRPHRAGRGAGAAGQPGEQQCKAPPADAGGARRC